MDAVIFNLDMYPEVSRPVTDYAYAAIHIKNRQLKVVNGETLKKLYREYCKYPAMEIPFSVIIYHPFLCIGVSIKIFT